MALVYRDAVRARELGMTGKWVGHPAQLFAVLLAYDAGCLTMPLEGEVAKLAAYSESVHGAGKGAMMIGGDHVRPGHRSPRQSGAPTGGGHGALRCPACARAGGHR